MPATMRKVLAYITHGQRLLVFNHPHSPEAGIQVPGGTLDGNESPAEAAIRESMEETGLKDFRLGALLGEHVRNMSDFGLNQIHHRYFYHLLYDGDPPQRWRHFENHASDGIKDPIAFDFYWARLPDEVPELTCDHGKLLPELFRALQEE
jgi:8-oxo-dGTP diphosphatase